MQILSDLQKEILKTFIQLADHEAFCLTGGTALSAFFLQHRRSHDLDFFTSTEEILSPFSLKLEAALANKKFSVSRLRGFQSFIEIAVSSEEDQTIVHLALDSPFRFGGV